MSDFGVLVIIGTFVYVLYKLHSSPESFKGDDWAEREVNGLIEQIRRNNRKGA